MSPKDQEAYQYLSSIYHERLFEYAKAFDLHQQWLSRFPEDISVLPDLAETHFTTGRFTEFSRGITPILGSPEIAEDTKIALRMVAVANLIATNNPSRVTEALAGLRKSIADQKADFRISWSFSGTLHFINDQQVFAPYRPWLNRFFGIADLEEKGAILDALDKLQADFPRSQDMKK